jgi:polyisoprenoid-binding protein YceI
MRDAVTDIRHIDIPAAGRYRLDPLRSQVTLRTRLFGLQRLSATMSITGGHLDIDPAAPRATVAAAIDAASFTTDNPRRDDDIRSPRFLHAEKHPEFNFLARSLSHDSGRWTLAGELTVRDVTRPVVLDIDCVEVERRGFRAHATTRVDRAAFGLTTAKWMGGRFFDIELTAAADPA